MDFTNENIIHNKTNSVEYIQFRKLLEYSDRITHAFTVGIVNDYRMPLYGSSTNILSKEQIAKNVKSYKNICNCIGINYNNIVKTNQVHKDIVQNVTSKINITCPDFYEKEYSETDGFITDKKNLALCTTNADCLVLMMYDTKKNVIANVHSGWRGTTKKIAVKAIDKMIEIYNCNPKDIICCISPSIRKCHFEVDDDVKKIFDKNFTSYDVTQIANKWHIDTVKLNTDMLVEKGLLEQNIIDSKICTVCNSNYIHSYRGSQKQNGLEMGIIELK